MNGYYWLIPYVVHPVLPIWTSVSHDWTILPMDWPFDGLFSILVGQNWPTDYIHKLTGHHQERGLPSTNSWNHPLLEPIAVFAAPTVALLNPPQVVRALCALDGGLLAAGGNDGCVRLWDTANGKLMAEKQVAQCPWRRSWVAGGVVGPRLGLVVKCPLVGGHC